MVCFHHLWLVEDHTFLIGDNLPISNWWKLTHLWLVKTHPSPIGGNLPISNWWKITHLWLVESQCISLISDWWKLFHLWLVETHPSLTDILNFINVSFCVFKLYISILSCCHWERINLSAPCSEYCLCSSVLQVTQRYAFYISTPTRSTSSTIEHSRTSSL